MAKASMQRAFSSAPSLSRSIPAPRSNFASFYFSTLKLKTRALCSAPRFSSSSRNSLLLSVHVPFLSVKINIPFTKMPKLKRGLRFSSGNVRGGNREILIQHLLVGEDDVKLLLELQRKIAEGEDLSDLAAEHSICPSKENGGMLGWVQKGQMVPEFEESAFSAPINKVVKCKTQFGWHLLQVLSEREESLLEDVEPEELHIKLQNPHFLDEAQLIDVREPDEVALASLKGFKVLPLQQFGNWGPEITNAFDPEKETYVMCHHGMRSFQVAKWLQTQGFKRVFNIAGGIHAYAVKADTSIPTY